MYILVFRGMVLRRIFPRPDVQTPWGTPTGLKTYDTRRVTSMTTGSMFVLFTGILFLVGGIFFVWQMIQYRNAKFETEKIREELRRQYEPLEKYRGLHDAEAAARKVKREARDVQAKRYAEAEKALEKAQHLQEITRSLRNIVDGYGDRYIESIDPFIDELAEEYDFRDAGLDLKAARKFSKKIIQSKQAIQMGDHFLDSEVEEAMRKLLLGYFNEQAEVILKRVKHDNYGVLKQKILDSSQKISLLGEPMGGLRISNDYLEARLDELKKAVVVRRLQEEDREEQREIRERLREEKQVQKELKIAEEDAKHEEEIIAKAIAETEERVREASDADRARLEAELADQRLEFERALAERERAKSMAEQTRKGTVYVISNVGSFGEGIYKVGLTRRLEPQDRVDELGDASVPFRFDVHALIQADDSPALESSLHDLLGEHRVNKVNRRKEFFRADLASIRSAVKQAGCGEVHWTMKAEAAEYRETLALLAKEKGVAPQDDLLHPSRRAEDELDAVLD
jgi:hypothetical protein